MRVAVSLFAFAMLAMPLAAARVEIVLDVSGSMRAAAGNVSRMEAAQQAVNATIGAIDASSNVALRLYGHRLPSEPKDASCRDTELVIPFGPLDRQRFASVVSAAKPLGQTPLAYALEQAAADFGQIGDEPVAVILVSDGEESCGGDPAKVACAFRARGLELTVHTVGFDVGAVARQQLQAIANCTGGEYRDAKNAGELSESLRQLTQAGLLIEKQRETRGGREVRGGNGFESAVPISPGTYRLDHHQRSGDFDYFAIDVKPGQLLQASQSTYEVGLTIKGTTITEEHNYPTAGVAIYRPDRVMIGENAQINAGTKAVVGASIAAGQGGTYYVLIGQKAWSDWGIHKESPFTIELTSAADAGSGTDAGATEKDAVKIEGGSRSAWIQPGDATDMYWFDAKEGANYELRVRPDGESYGLNIKVSDEDRVNLATVYAPNPGAVVRTEQIRPTRSGKLYVAVSNIATDKLIPYTIELTASGAAAATGAVAPGGGEGAAVAESAEGAPARKGIFSWIPGGGFTCAAVIGFLVVVFGGMLAIIVILLKKRKTAA